MSVAAWITALAALLTASVNVIGSIRHRFYDNRRFEEVNRKLERDLDGRT